MHDDPSYIRRLPDFPSVAPTASTAAISPANTPRFDVVGELKPLYRENTKNRRDDVRGIEQLLGS